MTEKVLKRIWTRSCVCFCLLLLGGCSLPFSLGSQPKTIYRLTPEIGSVGSLESTGKRLAIREIFSAGYIDSHRVVFSRELGQLGSYQYATWSELPAKQIADSLLMSLQKQGAFQSVARTTSGSIADLQLNCELIDFTHELFGGESKVHVTLQVELIDLQTRKILHQKLFDIQESVEKNDVEGAIAGFNRAVEKLVKELTSWLGEELSRQNP